MNFKDESIYYFKRIFERKTLQSKREKVSYNQFYKHKSIFVHIPKTAGVSVSVSLLGKPIAHLTALDYRTIYGKEEFNNCYKFSIVRNPFTRLISSYEFVQSGGYGPKDEKIVAIVKPYKSLGDFVMQYLTPATAKALRYFRPQHFFICDSNDHIMVDYLGHFEELEKDYEYIREKIGVGEPLQKLNVTKTKKLSFGEYYYNDEILQKVLSIYHKDFELFGYSKELSAIL